ncbi:MAG: molybdopterin biosynthesis protein [Desulfurococcales archaeon]|nr:molybdopterin biosynthesis protein [Desulfurococcales archaeon]
MIVMYGEAKVFHTLLPPNKVMEVLRRYVDLRPSGTEVVHITQSLGRVLAEDVIAPNDAPPYDRSEVDGYAVISHDTFGADEDNPIKLQLVGRVKIGEPPSLDIKHRTCCEIDTGAPIPRGADAVVMVEYTKKLSNNEIVVYRTVSPGENIAFTGTDITKNEVILRKGTLITPREVSVLAAVGVSKVKVYKKVKVGIISIGSELVSPGGRLELGKIFDVNQYLITSALSELGLNTKSYGILPDNEDLLNKALTTALSENDVVITSGGTSAGVEDITYRVTNRLGKPGVVIHGLKIKPGKPTFIAIIGKKLIFGLPGFPLSAAVVLHYVVKPILLRMSGIRILELPYVEAKLTTKVLGAKGRLTLVPVIVTKRRNGILHACPIPARSGSIRTLLTADGFVEVPEESDVLEANTRVKVLLLTKKLRMSELIVMGSHDYVLERVIMDKCSNKSVKIVNVGSLNGILAVGEGVADLAGTHLLDPETSQYNVPYIKRLGLWDKIVLIRGYLREVGLIIAKGNPKGITGIKDLLRNDIVMINRNKGSGTRTLLDVKLRDLARELNIKFTELTRKIRGYSYEVSTHTAVAAAVAQGRADVGLGIRYAAELYGLDFIKLGNELFDIVINKESINNECVSELIKFLKSHELNNLLNEFKGYLPHKNTGNIMEL